MLELIKKGAVPSLHVKLIFFLGLAALILLTFGIIYLYGAGLLPVEEADVYSSITLSLIFPTSVFAYLTYKGKSMGTIFSELGISRDRLNKMAVQTGVSIFIFILLIEIVLSILSQVFGISIPSTNVNQLLAGTPLFFLFFGVFITPFNEEIFFRGFLVPRFGVVSPALLFSLLHLGYGSSTEFAGALLFGLLAGHYFKKTKSLYATMIPHLLINLITIGSIVLAGG